MEATEKFMRWIAIATTVENDVIIAHDDITVLEQIAEFDFDVIVKVYGISDDEYNELKCESYEYRIRFKNARSTYLESWTRDVRCHTLSSIYATRISAFYTMKGRFEHALNKHRTLLTHQTNVYEAKYKEALHIKEHASRSPYTLDGFVRDYAEEMNIDINTAASIIIMKYDGWYQHMRKIERLRIRHCRAIKIAKTIDDFKRASTALDKDLFINMLL